MDFTPVFDFLLGLAPWVETLFSVLGTLVFVGMFVDSLIPDDKDGAFMSKILDIPILGHLLKGLKHFSPFDYKNK